MRITEITVRIHETVNLGDYSNYKSEVELRASLDVTDEADVVLGQLTSQATDQIADLVDDALERNGRSPKYAETLFCVRFNELRRCIVLYRRGIDLPKEKTWRDEDHWHSDYAGSYPSTMRFKTAQSLAYELRRTKDFPIFIVNEVDTLESIPPLPDPGPEPSWSIKKLESGLTALKIPKKAWEQVGELPHVDVAYLEHFYNWYRRTSHYLSAEQMVDMFLTGKTPWATPEPPLRGTEDIRYGYSGDDHDEEE